VGRLYKRYRMKLTHLQQTEGERATLRAKLEAETLAKEKQIREGLRVIIETAENQMEVYVGFDASLMILLLILLHYHRVLSRLKRITASLFESTTQSLFLSCWES